MRLKKKLMREEKNSEQKKYEPTISDLEWVFKNFRKSHGDHELSVLMTEIINENNNKIEEQTPIKKVNLFSTKKKKQDPYSYYFKKFNQIRSNKYFKKAVIFISVYLLIYSVLNAPMYIERVKWSFASTTKEKVRILESETIQTPMAESAPLDIGEVVSPSPTLIIPKINVNAPIITAESREEAEIQKNLKNGVVKYQNTANPGEVGNSFIIGHSSGYFWDNSLYKYAFVLLDRLEEGDDAKIYFNNKKYVYEVTEKKIVEPTDVSVIKNTDEPYLSLMTCYPPGTTNKRLVVTLRQTSPEYIKPKTVLREKEIEVPENLPTSDSESLFSKIFFFWR